MLCIDDSIQSHQLTHISLCTCGQKKLPVRAETRVLKVLLDLQCFGISAGGRCPLGLHTVLGVAHSVADAACSAEWTTPPSQCGLGGTRKVARARPFPSQTPPLMAVGVVPNCVSRARSATSCGAQKSPPPPQSRAKQWRALRPSQSRRGVRGTRAERLWRTG